MWYASSHELFLFLHVFPFLKCNKCFRCYWKLTVFPFSSLFIVDFCRDFFEFVLDLVWFCEAILLDRGNNSATMHFSCPLWSFWCFGVQQIECARRFCCLSDSFVLCFQLNDGLPLLRWHLFGPHLSHYSEKIHFCSLLHLSQNNEGPELAMAKLLVSV